MLLWQQLQHQVFLSKSLQVLHTWVVYSTVSGGPLRLIQNEWEAPCTLHPEALPALTCLYASNRSSTERRTTASQC